ncbi:MAG: mannose-1-phosphate guanylyltransferase [Fimbriimonadaceae bacterium]
MAGERYCVIMAGGSGTRFWPVSTTERPKQFVKLASPDSTLLEDAVARASQVNGRDNVLISTGKHLKARSLRTIHGLEEEQVLAEPTKRNTGGAMVWVVANLIARHPEDWKEVTLGVLTADHRITPTEKFVQDVRIAMEAAENTGGLVTIGIRPDRPETGYGYIEEGSAAGRANEVKRFREKPDLDTAKAFLEAGNFLWNSGMFFWTLEAFMREMKHAAPDLAEATEQIAEALKQGDANKAEEIFEGIRGVSIDYALMEKAEKVLVVEADFDWDDLGAWDAVSRTYMSDSDGNVHLGPSRLVYTKDSIVYNESTKQEVAVLGMENVVVVVTDDTVLVVPKNRAQEVKRFTE